MPFYKHMLQKKPTLQDIESIDHEFYNSLVWMRLDQSPILNVMWDEWHNNIFPSVHTLCLNAYPLCHISTPPNLRYILYAHSFRDNNIEECGLEMFFSCDFEVLGVVKSHELTVGGATKQVTEQNKNEYIELVLLRRCGQWLCHDGIGSHRLLTQWRFKRGVEEQMKAFMDGFSEVVPLHWLQCFDERELEVIDHFD